MENEEIKKLYSRVLKGLSLWAAQSFRNSLLVVFILLIIGIPIITTLQDLVKTFPYLSVTYSILDFINSNYRTDYFLLFLTILIIFILIANLFKNLQNNNMITDNFTKGLYGWAIPTDSDWTMRDCGDVPGKMLTVYNSVYPGTLKGAYWWYDYEVSFHTKIDKDTRNRSGQSFNVVVRSESNFNGIILKISKTDFQPYFLYDGTMIKDTDGHQKLPTILSDGEWIKVKLIVKGNNIDILINDYDLQYKIPTKVFDKVEISVLSKDLVNIEEIENSNNQILNAIEILNMQESAAKKEAMKTIKSFLSNNLIPPYTKVILEYQKGSVGFMEEGREKAHFRDFRIKRI